MAANITDKFKISLDQVDLELLRGHIHRQHSGNMLWSANQRKEDFVEFEVTMKDGEENGDCEENLYKCYICNIQVPRTYRTEHENSKKHKTCVAITNHSVDRIRNYTQNLDLNPPCTSDTVRTDSSFCDTCCLVINGEKDTHNITKEHLTHLENDMKLSDLAKIYVGDNIEIKNDASKKITEVEITNVNDDLKLLKLEDTESVDQSKIKNDVLDSFVWVDMDQKLLENAEKGNQDIVSDAIEGNQVTGFIKDEIEKVVKTEMTNEVICNDEDSETSKNMIKLNEENKEFITHSSPFITVSSTENTDRNTDEVQDIKEIPDISLDNTNINALMKYFENLSKDYFTGTTHAVEVVDLEFLNITTLSGDVVKVKVDNYHGFCNVRNHVQCRVCRVMVDDENEHKATDTHKKNISTVIADKHCIRLTHNDVNHCILCNEIVGSSEIHTHDDTHAYLLKNACIAPKATSKPTDFTDSHFLKTNKTTNELSCTVCEIKLSRNEVDDHFNSRSHEDKYNLILQKNRILKRDDRYICEFCIMYINEANIIKHVKTNSHIKLVQYVPPKDLVPSHTLRTVFFVLVDDELYCKLCDIKIPNNNKAEKEHPKTSQHLSKLENLAAKNKVYKYSRATYICNVCHVYIPNVEVYLHVLSDEHFENLHHKKDKPRTMSLYNADIISAIDNALDAITDSLSDKVDTVASNKDEDSSTVCTTNEELDSKTTSEQPLDNVSEDDSDSEEVISNPLNSARFNEVISKNSHLIKVINGSRVTCRSCDCTISTEGAIEHFDGIMHSIKYKRFLEAHCIETKNTALYCKYCDINIKNESLIRHVDSHIHKKYGKNKPKVTNEVCEDTTNLHESSYLQSIQESLKETLGHYDNDGYCELCKISVPNNPLLKDRRINEIIHENNIRTIKLGLYLLKDIGDNEIQCLICNVRVSRGGFNIEEHLLGKKHAMLYNDLLFKNDITLSNDQYSCDYCKKNIGNDVLAHVISDEHKSHFKVTDTKKEPELVRNKVIDDTKTTNANEASMINDTTAIKDETTEDINYMMVRSGPYRVRCKICCVTVPISKTSIEEHIAGEYHVTKYKTLLAIHKCEVQDVIHCGICNVDLAEGEEIDHINNISHKIKREQDKLNNTKSYVTKMDYESETIPANVKKSKLHFLMEPTNKSKMYKCKVCTILVSGKSKMQLAQQVKQHLEGRKHTLGFENLLQANSCKQTSVDEYHCNCCGYFIKEPLLIEHIHTKKHIAKRDYLLSQYKVNWDIKIVNNYLHKIN